MKLTNRPPPQWILLWFQVSAVSCRLQPFDRSFNLFTTQVCQHKYTHNRPDEKRRTKVIRNDRHKRKQVLCLFVLLFLKVLKLNYFSFHLKVQWFFFVFISFFLFLRLSWLFDLFCIFYLLSVVYPLIRCNACSQVNLNFKFALNT